MEAEALGRGVRAREAPSRRFAFAAHLASLAAYSRLPGSRELARALSRRLQKASAAPARFLAAREKMPLDSIFPRRVLIFGSMPRITQTLILALIASIAVTSSASAFTPETALRADRQFSQHRVGANPSYLPEMPQQNTLGYGGFASDSPLASRGGALYGPRTVGAAERIVGKVLQTGGNTIRNQTARDLNKALGQSLKPREWGRTVEALKKDLTLPRDFHGVITSTGEYLDKSGNILGNLLDYL